MKKQFAALLALSTAAACVLSYQPVQAGAESVLDSMTQENLTDITNEQKDAFYQSSLGEIEPSAEPSELEQAATANGMYKDTFSFTNHSCNLSEDDFNQKVFEPIWNSMTNIERLAYLNKSSVYRNVCQGSQCFGMAALSILVHNGELSPSDIQAGAETLHDITLTNDVEQLITYYDMLLEYQAVSNVVMYAPTLLTQDERVDNLLNCAERCKEKGTYFMVAIRAGGTHMIVGMDKVSGSWTFDGVNYDTCIVAYDSNFYNKTTKESLFNDNACIYVNSKTKQFCIPAYGFTSEKGESVLYASDDDSVLTYRAPLNGTTEINTDASNIVNLHSYRGITPEDVSVTATDADGSTHDFLSECKLRSSDSNYYGTGSAFHLEKTKRSNGFDFYLKGKGYRVEVSQYPQGGSMSSPYDKRTYDVGTKCKVDITGDSISYTNTDTASLPLEFSMAYDEGNYNFSPLNAAKVTFDVAPNQTITITKKDTGFALTTNMETVVTINPEYNDDAINAFEGSEHDFVQYVTAYYLRFVMESNAMVNYNMEKKCSELSFDFNNDGVYDESPIAGDADCNGVPYEINDIYWTMQQIAESGAYGAGIAFAEIRSGCGCRRGSGLCRSRGFCRCGRLCGILLQVIHRAVAADAVIGHRRPAAVGRSDGYLCPVGEHAHLCTRGRRCAADVQGRSRHRICTGIAFREIGSVRGTAAAAVVPAAGNRGIAPAQRNNGVIGIVQTVGVIAGTVRQCSGVQL